MAAKAKAPESGIPVLPPSSLVPVADLVPYARNSRTHSPEQVDQVAASMKEWGFTNPILVDEGMSIIAGHCRLLAAHKLGLVRVPVIVAAGWTEAQKRAYVIADNKLALNAGWDLEMLRVEFQELLEEGFDMPLLGFSDDEFADVLADRTVGLTDPDDAPALEPDAVSKLGDVWLLGAHRLICGDTTDADVVAKLLGSVKPNLMVTDPPYGVDYDPRWRLHAGLNDENAAGGKVKNDDRADWREAWALFPGNIAYVWHGGLHAQVVAESLMSCKFLLRAQIVWVKTRPVIGRGAYHWQHEPALYSVREGAEDDWRFEPEHEVGAYAVKKGATANWHGGRKQSTVWFIEHLKSGTGHGTQKPVECMKRPIENNSNAGQAVYEPFSGSGTTIIAAEMTGRCCFAGELDPCYVDVAVKRWQDFTGKTAILEGTERTFDAVAADAKSAREAS